MEIYNNYFVVFCGKYASLISMATKTEAKLPTTLGMKATADDWKLIHALKMKTGLFKTGDLLRHALQTLAHSKGIK